MVKSSVHGKEPSGSIKHSAFVDYIKYYQLLKKDCSMELVSLRKAKRHMEGLKVWLHFSTCYLAMLSKAKIT